MIRHQMSFIDPAVFLRGQIPKHIAQMLAQFLVPFLAPALGYKNHVVLAIPFCVA
jgi:hypothetical protein